ncbi:MAG: DNA-directed RNA polymerase subunit A'' [Candidatus Aenigmarchaeota archaeon]|nr:DNA-directed RNA polymerase subunit A'' [Candidatus Aenigmarchaeota archaeon]
MKLNEKQKEMLVKAVEEEYNKSRFEPGESIGILAAQSISEPATQLTMRTYHVAGSLGIKVTLGLPRLIEIFDAKKKIETPMMIIYLKKEYNTKEKAEEFANKIIERRVYDLTKNISLDLFNFSIQIEPRDKRKTEKIAGVIEEKIGGVKVKVKEGNILVEMKKKEEVQVTELQKLKDDILNLVVEGIEGVTAAIVRSEENRWLIQTLGSNLEKVLMMEEVDETRTYSNDIYEVYEIFGIEAVRNLIVREAYKTMQEQGLDVNIRYLYLLADIMTWSGEIMSIGRYGVAGAKHSVLSRAAFEETIKHLARAAIRGEVDEFKGMFENVMIGQVAPTGTGMFELVVKREKDERERKDKRGSEGK